MINQTENNKTNDLQVKMQIHYSPESIFLEHWNFEKDLTFEELLECPAGGMDGTGKEIEMKMSEVFEDMKENGFWGYADLNTNTIHLWLGRGNDLDDLRKLLGHEVGHLLEGAAEYHDDPHIADEQRADNYGKTCVLVERFIKQILAR